MWNRNFSNYTLISALWTFYMLNLFARDLHELARPGILEQAMSGVFDGVVITEGLMLVGGIMAEFPIMMALFSLVLRQKTNRCLNLVAAPVAIAMTFWTNQNPDLDNIFFMVIQIAALLVVVRISWVWKEEG